MQFPFLRPFGRVFSTLGRKPATRLAAAAVIFTLGAVPATTAVGAIRTTSAATAAVVSTASPVWCQPPTGQGSDWQPGSRTISGRVTDSAAVGLVDISVEIVQAGDTWGRSVQTNPDGTYAIHELPDGDYLFKFFDWTGAYQGGFYAGAGNPLALTPTGATTVSLAGTDGTVNAALQVESHFDITGWVHDSAGNPVNAAHLDAEAAYFSMRSCGESLPDGTYTVSGARVGAYPLMVSAPGQPTGYYSSASPTGFVTSAAEATLVTVATANVPNINIQFPQTFSLSGSVMDGDGNVPPGMVFTACEVATDYCQSDYSADPSGLFSISTLVAGDYIVSEGDFDGNYRNGYYGGDGVFAPSINDATLIHVSANVTGINMLAVLAPRVSGTIVDSANAPVTDIYVDLCHVTDIYDCLNSIATLADGTFMTGGVQPGTYTLFVRDSRDPAEHASGYLGTSAAGTLVADPANARQITVGDTDVGPINVKIQDGGRVAATVMKGTDLGRGAYVIVCLTVELCYSGGPSTTTRSSPVRR